MIDIELKPYPGEDEDSFIKRKAYYIRILMPRIKLCTSSCLRKMTNSRPIYPSVKMQIDAFWSRYLLKFQRAQIIDYSYYDIYNKVLREGEELYEYMPDSFYYLFIDDYFTNPQHSNPCDDKNLYDLYFHDVKRPITVFRKANGFILDKNYREISFNDIISLCKDENEVILKKGKFSFGGKGIMFWNTQKPLKELLSFISDSPNVICQRVIKQHPELSRLNSSSVNTIRIMTLAFDGQVHVLSSVIRMGINGSRVDNASSGGIVCGIKQNGQLKGVAYNMFGEKFIEHPQGTAFDSVIVPNFNKCCDMVSTLAMRMSSISRLVSWDIAIDEVGDPLLIEFNASCGELDFHQYCNGPIFGDLTDCVLEEVFANSYTLNSIIKSYS